MSKTALKNFLRNELQGGGNSELIGGSKNRAIQLYLSELKHAPLLRTN